MAPAGNRDNPPWLWLTQWICLWVGGILSAWLLIRYTWTMLHPPYGVEAIRGMVEETRSASPLLDEGDGVWLFFWGLNLAVLSPLFVALGLFLLQRRRQGA